MGTNGQVWKVDDCGQRIRFIEADVPTRFCSACNTTYTCLHPKWINHCTAHSSAVLNLQHLLPSEHQEPPHCWLHTLLTNIQAAPRITWVFSGSKPADPALPSQALWHTQPCRAQGLPIPQEIKPAQTTPTAALGNTWNLPFSCFPKHSKTQPAENTFLLKASEMLLTQNLSASTWATTQTGLWEGYGGVRRPRNWDWKPLTSSGHEAPVAQKPFHTRALPWGHLA